MQKNLVFSTIAGLSGALAMATYAASAHAALEMGTDNNLAVIAPILLAHAPVFLVLSLLAAHSKAAFFGGSAVAIGLLLFCGDLAMRHFTGERLFPFAAPTGGSILILGWLTIAFTGWSSRKPS